MDARRTAFLLALALSLALTGATAQTGDEDWGGDWDDWGEEEADSGLRWTGFLELGLGRRSGDGVTAEDTTLEELRWRLETLWIGERLEVGFKADLARDEVLNEFDAELRELSLKFSPTDNSDLRLGRQVLTWGTGDFLFLNDLFPKDFQSFFAGREDEYLKAPSDSIRWTIYGEAVNLDLAWTPEFEPDRYLNGERFSFFSPQAGARVMPEPPLVVPGPDAFPEDGELALRLYRTLGSTELAAYGYRGFFKGPEGARADGTPYYPRLNVWGASLRRPLGPGLINAELAWYDSREDGKGSDPRLPNDQFRLLLGWEQELVTNLTLGLQGYWEHTADHAALLANSPAPGFEPEQDRTVLTTRLTWRALQDRLTASLFAFASPSDEDYHLRPRLDYRYSDAWQFSVGANAFGGDEEHTFFGQLDGNDNVYLRIRYNY